MLNATKTQLISEKLTQKPKDSKKALYAFVAAASVLLVFAVSAVLILFHSEVSKDIVELANLVVLFFGALATTLITGQSTLDWKAMSVLGHMDSSEDAHDDVNSNQPINSVDISHERSPKDFLRDSTF